MTQRYSAYKDSGVGWIGKIPEHWEVTRISNLGSFYKGNGIKKDEVRLEGLPCIRYGEIYTTYDRIVSSVRSFIDEVTAEESVQGFKGDVLFAGSGETIEDIGKAVLYFGDGAVYIGGDIIVLRLTQGANSLFLSYVVNSHYVQHQKTIVGKGEIVVHIYSKAIRDIRITLPPAIEQSQIVEFLDAKTSLIDRLIDVKQRRIELLKEKRSALINHAVTKGLDPNVKMKDSGIEWIGEIPKHWEVRKMKYGVSNPSVKILPETGVIKISPENIESDTGICTNFYSDYEGEGFQFFQGDILFNKLRIYLKKILFAEQDGISMGEMIVLRCDDSLNNKYLFFMLFNDGLINLLNAQSTGVKMPRVAPEVILNSEIIFPPIYEQYQIVTYLDTETQKIDKLVTLEQKKIDLLKEYRQALISETVTGKIKVTND